MSWGIAYDMELRHVVPNDDLRDHRLGTDCECRPSLEYGASYILIAHNAWDAREYYEHDQKSDTTQLARS